MSPYFTHVTEVLNCPRDRDVGIYITDRNTDSKRPDPTLELLAKWREHRAPQTTESMGNSHMALVHYQLPSCLRVPSVRDVSHHLSLQSPPHPEAGSSSRLPHHIELSSLPCALSGAHLEFQFPSQQVIHWALKSPAATFQDSSSPRG